MGFLRFLRPLRLLVSSLSLSVRLFRDPRVPMLTKSLPVMAFVYLLSPLDFIPDVLPLIGEVDDLALLVAAQQLFLYLCPAPALEFHRAAIAAGRRYSPIPNDKDFIDI